MGQRAVVNRRRLYSNVALRPLDDSGSGRDDDDEGVCVMGGKGADHFVLLAALSLSLSLYGRVEPFATK